MVNKPIYQHIKNFIDYRYVKRHKHVGCLPYKLEYFNTNL